MEASLFSSSPLIESAFVSGSELADREAGSLEEADSEKSADERVMPVGETVDPLVFRVSDSCFPSQQICLKSIDLIFQSWVASPRAPPV